MAIEFKGDIGSYNSKEIEQKWAKQWRDENVFDPKVESEKPPYCIVIPPPNVTGALHMGHALMLSIEDALIRYKRMNGFDSFWVPGTDHAGIATQMVVDRELRKQGSSRHDLGREKFVEKIWEWREKYGRRIDYQMDTMGCALSWNHYHFTLDEGFCKAVRKVFADLYKEGLIYRGTRLIHWCPKDRTALSDLEVDFKEVKGKLYHIRYPLEDGSHVVVSTTRPETILGDTGVAIHPDDPRYTHLKGKSALVPFVDRKIPIIEDATLVDMEFGTGVVKVTPGHDFNDYETGKRHDLEQINILDEAAIMNENAGKFCGMPVMKCREALVADLDEMGLLEGIEDHVHQVGHSERSGAVVEPRLSLQWFCNAEVLAKPALEAVKDGRIKITPDNFRKVYYHWMENIKEWCISRQLWWGHRIPAWHCSSCGHISVSADDISSCENCGSNEIEQDSDVLDTWFSSALWPFGTLGWPEETPLLKKYYPTAVLETGSDILFFWVARMVMMGMHFMGDVPFREIYLHSMVRDKHGQKMSKTKNNVIDPLDISEKYSVDALRFTLLSLNTPGRDIKLDPNVVKGYSAFANKLWNAARLFVISKNKTDEPKELDFDLSALEAELGNALLSETSQLQRKVKDSLDNYRFDEASQAIYQFLWYRFCDWYLEVLKFLVANGHNDKTPLLESYEKALVSILKVLHPFMPFITEELSELVLSGDESYLIDDQWSVLDVEVKGNGKERLEWLIDVVSAVRSVRGETGLSPKEKLSVHLVDQNNQESDLAGWSFLAKGLGNLSSLEFHETKPDLKACSLVVKSQKEVYIDLSGLIDIEKEVVRIEKAIKNAKKDIQFFEKKLNNPKFVKNAPEELVTEQKEKLGLAKEAHEKLVQNRDLIKG